MLSILIPIYNYNVYPLVQELHKQCLECGIIFEILCQDDASNSPLNQINEAVNSLTNSSFVALKKNIAHRENRNSLAAKAKYDYLLFIDGDSIIISPNYIQIYISNLCNFEVIYGGRIHPKKCPSENQKLRWKYGRFTEDKIAINRSKKPYQSILFNNTIIKKSCFDKVKFDSDLKKYGHDDTQLSYQLSLLKISVLHIDNPIKHGAIDTNLEYIIKTKESLENLLLLYDDQKIDRDFVRLIKLYVFIEKTKVKFIITKTYSVFSKFILKNLIGENPNLLVFNIFRIGYLCSISSKKQGIIGGRNE
ncbi:glycosyltransferase [Flavobacterium sp. P4023]|uniref:Glycosyltransferase n=1 Tax=Flavobacterium flabelliforme TaxID=2816119 RepID=A0ABS5CSI8_9FLAO|nr:glycosyltransferase [Flavobacterium flabelliforme]MBP4141578.1 glycosyltransferase [Flavobacterium flabelliforme]